MNKFLNYVVMFLSVQAGFVLSFGYRLYGFILLLVAFMCQNASEHVKMQREKERELCGVLIAEVPSEYLNSNKREDKKRIKQIMKIIKAHKNDFIAPISQDPNVVFKFLKE